MYSHDRKAKQIVEELLELLRDDYIYDSIVKPIEKVMFDFDTTQGGPVTYKAFIDTIGRFVQNVFKFGLRVKQDISKEHAISIAFTILETVYVGTESRGLDAAYLEVVDPNLEGLDLIISKMTQVIISMEHAKHTNWVFEKRIGSLDWQARCRIADVILKRMGAHTPHQLAGGNPALFSNDCDFLLSELIKFEKRIYRHLSEGTG